MSGIDVTTREMQRAYKSHRNAYCCLKEQDIADTNPSKGIILFYAVETGLKLVWLKRRMARDTSCWDARYKTHNINFYLKELRAGRSLLLSSTIHLENRGESSKIEQEIPIGDLNQAMRYGVKISLEHETILQLEKIVSWIEEER